MRLRAILGIGFMLLVMALIFFPAQAHAYLDPGTGSYFIQIALAAIAGALSAANSPGAGSASSLHHAKRSLVAVQMNLCYNASRRGAAPP